MPNPKLLNKTQLAKALRISRRTVTVYFARPGAPEPTPEGLFALPEAKAWAEQCAASAKAGNTSVDPVYKDLRRERMELEVKQLRRKDALEAGKLVPVSEIEPTIAAFNAELVDNMRQEFEFTMPQKCQGKSVIECQQLFAAAIDRIIANLKSGQWALGLPEG